MSDIKIVSTQSRPICPHCNQEITTIEKVENVGFFEITVIYICSLCKKVLSIGYNFGT